MRVKSSLTLLYVIALGLGVVSEAHGESVSSGVADSCTALVSADFSNIQDAPTQVTEANFVKENNGAPAYCQVKAYVTLQVGIELRLPGKNWNGKFMEVGCGGWCGVIDASACDVPLRRGYACIASDMGHKGSGGDLLWAWNNLPAQIDFGYRATHVVALAGKAIAASYYSKPPRRSYFVGCSAGGYQGVTEAQRFPWDFDGIVAGAPDIDVGAASLRVLWIDKVLLDDAEKPRLTQGQLRLVHESALAKCDMDDGVKDGIIGNPLACRFQPEELICKANNTKDCLTPAQADTVRKLYAGPMTSTGERISTGGYLPGSELMWEQFFPPIGVEQFFKYAMENYSTGQTWKYTDYDFDQDYKRLGITPWYDNSNPDLRKFARAGGKLIVYHGNNDTVDLPGAVTDYYDTVVKTMGGRSATEDFFRLFMVPGMNHCTLGDGAFAVDWLNYLETWVEKGHAPDKIIGSHVKVEDVLQKAMQGDRDASNTLERRLELPLNPAVVTFSRPIYPYPTVAKYLGHGDPKDATSFGPVNP